MRGQVVLGLDLSYSGLGMCAVPTDWDCELSRVRAETRALRLPRNPTTREQLQRLASLALDVRVFAVRVGASHVWIEGLPVKGGSKVNGRSLIILGELRAAVRLELLRELGLCAELAEQSSARKLLLGHLPTADRKLIVEQTVRSMPGSAVFEDGDQIDAFVAANWGLSELGAPCIALLPPGKKRSAA